MESKSERLVKLSRMVPDLVPRLVLSPGPLDSDPEQLWYVRADDAYAGPKVLCLEDANNLMAARPVDVMGVQHFAQPALAGAFSLAANAAMLIEGMHCSAEPLFRDGLPAQYATSLSQSSVSARNLQSWPQEFRDALSKGLRKYVSVAGAPSRGCDVVEWIIDVGGRFWCVDYKPMPLSNFIRDVTPKESWWRCGSLESFENEVILGRTSLAAFIGPKEAPAASFLSGSILSHVAIRLLSRGVAVRVKYGSAEVEL